MISHRLSLVAALTQRHSLHTAPVDLLAVEMETLHSRLADEAGLITYRGECLFAVCSMHCTPETFLGVLRACSLEDNAHAEAVWRVSMMTWLDHVINDLQEKVKA